MACGLRSFACLVMLRLGCDGHNLLARGGLQQAYEIFDGADRLMQKTGGELAAKRGEHLADSLVDVFRIEAKVFVEMVTRQNGKLHQLDFLQRALGLPDNPSA